MNNLSMARPRSRRPKTSLRAIACAFALLCAAATAAAEGDGPITWTPVGLMITARAGHTAIWLQTGQVLVVGGLDGSSNALSSAELYDPLFGTWTATGPMQTPRFFHTATLLPSGKVLVAGGRTTQQSSAPDLATAELYDPATGKWTTTASMAAAHALHTATLLAKGDVLVFGGESTTAVELYDWKTETWTTTSSYSSNPITDHTATLLPDGRVLVIGGCCNLDSFNIAALYDPSTGRWASTGALNTDRSQHVAMLLPKGLVLVTGGQDLKSNNIADPELYDIPSGTWKSISGDTDTGALRAAVLLDSGRALIVGGADTGAAVIYDSAGNQWTSTPPMLHNRAGHTATRVLNGTVSQVLVAGGGPLQAEIFDQSVGSTWSPVISLVTPVTIGERIGVEGQMFRGQSEGSGGNASQNSSTGYPTALIVNSASSSIRFLGVDPIVGWTDTTFTSTPLADFPTGAATLYLMSNGLASKGWPISVQSKPAAR